MADLLLSRGRGRERGAGVRFQSGEGGGVVLEVLQSWSCS